MLPTWPPSVTLGLIMLVRQTKKASSIKHVSEQYQKVNVFFAPKTFTTLITFFQRKFSFQGPGYALSLCALFIAYVNPMRPCVFHSLEVGISPSQIPASYELCCMFVFPCLGVLGGVKKSLLCQNL